MKRSSLILVAALALLTPWLAYTEDAASYNASVVTISTEQAKKLYDLGATFIDVRDEEEWRLGHIENAHHVEFDHNFSRLRELESVDEDTPLVIYCNSRNCETGIYASAVSLFWGFSNVFYYAEGYFSWILQDYPAVMNLTATLD